MSTSSMTRRCTMAGSTAEWPLRKPEMHCVMAPVAFLLLVPLVAGQAVDKPSPMPEKSRKSVSNTKTPGKSVQERPSPNGEARAKANGTSSAERAAGAGEVTKETGKACYFTSSIDGAL